MTRFPETKKNIKLTNDPLIILRQIRLILTDYLRIINSYQSIDNETVTLTEQLPYHLMHYIR